MDQYKAFEEQNRALIDELTTDITVQVAETQEQFIFETISPFIQQHSRIEISKQELVEAIQLLRMKNEALEKYGVVISNDLNTAPRQKCEMDRSYRLGYKDGVEKERNRINDLLRQIVNEK